MATGARRPHTLVRLLAEGATVVVSILIAFSLDAWWSERELRQQVAEDLFGIDRELADNTERIRWQIDIMSRVVGAGQALLSEMDAEPASRSLSVPDTLAWLTLLGISPTLDASFGGVDALIASGRLSAVRSPELRTGLAGLKAQVEDVVEEEYLNRTTEYDRMHPILDTLFDKAQLFRLAPRFFDEQVPGRPLNGVGQVQVPNTLGLRNVIRSRNGNMGTALVGMRHLLVVISELREMIAAEVQ